MVEERRVSFERAIRTTPEAAFEALTRASELREWCCDSARTDPRVGGWLEMGWNSGYRAQGRYTVMEPSRHVEFTWQGAEPAETLVEATVEPLAEGVRVRLVHRGFGDGEAWDKALAESEEGWSSGLENLQSTLETGIDQRLLRKPFMGIFLDLLTPERAEKEGIAAEAGIYINNALDGSPAQRAGLQRGDVIVSMAGTPTPGYHELGSVLEKHHSGDVLPMEVVRGQERLAMEITLGKRSIPEVPSTAAELADRVGELYRQSDAALLLALEGVSDEESGVQPAEGEWSVKEVLAHLSIVERDQHCYLAVFCLDGWLDTGPTNPSVISGRMAAVMLVDPSLADLVDRFRKDEAETVAFLRGLPAEAVQHKARFRRIAVQMIQLPDHTHEHLEQIKAAIAAVRGQ
ncbi:MAG TPA: SRPBCC domain-containing protein [Anaerolineae bacterium]|nr:SRPBCC domain-containing protein [Anaerolineae bacterium]